MYLKSLLAGTILAILIFLSSFILPNYTLSTLFSFVAALLVFGSIFCSAFVSLGGRSGNTNRKKQMQWSIMFALAAVPNFIGFIISYYF
ncbi:hypothetical protein [Listeria fleischmannii]|uniref:Uncharacterized protein n=2 Tax=Listeria fleischmannii TaxID=1069827 RepID=A0A841YBV7_9LIST|nr:hypothetical protein [Listeria fleischmannii]MBC1397698.1 hypothetical protein [Listeria fleischmannii]MBC1426761.1 hypothetical protein [Listeria fleischmannii]